MNDYKFPVEFRKLVAMPASLAVMDKHAVVRTDSKKVIGVVSKKYALVPHADVVDTFRKAFAEDDTKEKFELTHNGARLHYEVQFPKIQVQVSPKDKMTMRLVVKNSYDGSQKLQIVLGAFRLVCSNGMTIGRKFLTINRRHVGEVALKVDEIKEQVVMMKENFKNTQPVLQAMANMHLPTGEASKKFFDHKVMHLPNYLLSLAAIEYQKADDNTAWGAYNALTFAITHKMKKPNPHASLVYGQRAWDAVAALFK